MSPSEAERGSFRRRLRIVVADDQRDAVDTLTEILRLEGHETRGVYDGLNVVDAVEDFGPHAVLLDIGMPRLSGYEIASMLRDRLGAKTPLLIAVTAYKKDADRILAKRAGFDHHVAKPYDSRTILDLLEPLLSA